MFHIRPTDAERYYKNKNIGIYMTSISSRAQRIVLPDERKRK